MNVRCPHCSAVFPSGPLPDSGSRAVECPLCLLRFDAKGEGTVSVAQAAPTGRAGSADDEFEQFGLGGQVQAAINTGLTVPLVSSPGGPSAPPVAPRTMAPARPMAPADDEVDFEALLSDAVGAVEKYDRGAPPPSSRSNPYVRISAPRSGGPAPVAVTESVFGATDGAREPLGAGANKTGVLQTGTSRSSARISQVAPNLETQAPTQVLSGGSGAGAGGFQPFVNTHATADFLAGFGTPAGAGSADSNQPFDPFAAAGGGHAAPKEDDSLFESPGSYSPTDSDQPRSRPPSDLNPARPIASVAPATSGAVKSKKPLLTFDRLLGFAMVLAAAGVVTDYLGLGLFARNLWSPPPPPARAERPLPKDLATPVLLDDTRKAYELELARLDKALKVRPDSTGLQLRRVSVYLDLLERYPESIQEDPEIKRGFDELVKSGKFAGPRLMALEALTRADVAGALAQYDALKVGSSDDRGVAARVRLTDFVQRVEGQALNNPGLTAAPEIDPLQVSGAEEPGLVEAKAMLDATLAEARGAPNASKLTVLQAEFNDRMGKPAEVIAALEPLVAKAPDHLDARLLLGSAYLESGRLDDAHKQLDHITLALQGDVKAPAVPRKLAFAHARLAARHGDREAQIAALNGQVQANPGDEVAVVRYTRLALAEKHLDDAIKALNAGKKTQKFKSVAFEVVFVEYWLTVNRNEDALAELREATKLYKDSIELLYLRGQVEDKQAHFATARDYFSQVLQREPKHLRASIRLAELQATSNRHDEALATLDRARAAVGDEETLLRMRAETLVALKRDDEARKVLEQLLALAPENRKYLLRAAQMDLKAGQTDQALTYLRKLRTQKALDREAAVQLARALGDKKDYGEAASTIEPFADQFAADVELNCMAGEYWLDANQLEKAATYINRAVQTANGKSAMALFQWGRLAFKKGDVGAGTTRIRQAIALDPMAHQFRYELGRTLIGVKNDANSRKVAVEELETIVRSSEGLAAAGHPVKYLPDVHRQLARAFLDAHDYARAARHLRVVLDKTPDDMESKGELGRALFSLASPQAVPVLREVVARRPGDARAALYLGLSLLSARQTSDALPYLQQAANSGDKRLVEAWYHMALIHKERDQIPQALRAIDTYLERAPADETYRPDAESQRRSLQGSLGGKKKKAR